MRLVVRLLGLTLLEVEASTDEDADSTSPEPDPRDLSGGTTGAYPVGFVASPGDQRWESGVELD